jgi:hypothetical protein
VLQAPTTESCERTSATRTPAEPELQRTLHPRYSGFGGLDNAVSLGPQAGAAQFRRQVAGLQRTIGNQAVLRMLSRSAPAIERNGEEASARGKVKPNQGKHAAAYPDRGRLSAVLAGQVGNGAQVLSTPGPVLQRQNASTQNPTVPAPSCSPTLLQPQSKIGNKPVSFPSGQGCNLRLVGSGLTVNGMEFTGQIQAKPTCPGKVYFVQYAKVNRSFVGCNGRKLEGFCAKRPWGLDTGWPYPFGNQISLAQGSSAVAPIKAIDSPGSDNISDPTMNLVRICIDDEFVTYVVFENGSGNVTSLGWINWLFTAHAERGTGQCPSTGTTNDCAGWTVTGLGVSVGSNFTAGTSGPQPLDKSVQSVNRLPDDCPDTSCPKQ